jgi:hypothetical protein
MADHFHWIDNLYVPALRILARQSASHPMPINTRTPLAIVVHILPGRRIVVRPTLAEIGSVSAARTHGASIAELAAADVHRTSAADAPLLTIIQNAENVVPSATIALENK